jgi:hypothetical protein
MKLSISNRKRWTALSCQFSKPVCLSVDLVALGATVALEFAKTIGTKILKAVRAELANGLGDICDLRPLDKEILCTHVREKVTKHSCDA